MCAYKVRLWLWADPPGAQQVMGKADMLTRIHAFVGQLGMNATGLSRRTNSVPPGERIIKPFSPFVATTGAPLEACERKARRRSGQLTLGARRVII